jgi:hypothetical protein
MHLPNIFCFFYVFRYQHLYSYCVTVYHVSFPRIAIEKNTKRSRVRNLGRAQLKLTAQFYASLYVPMSQCLPLESQERVIFDKHRFRQNSKIENEGLWTESWVQENNVEFQRANGSSNRTRRSASQNIWQVRTRNLQFEKIDSLKRRWFGFPFSHRDFSAWRGKTRSPLKKLVCKS